jgi:hypothetical protein
MTYNYARHPVRFGALTLACMLALAVAGCTKPGEGANGSAGDSRSLKPVSGKSATAEPGVGTWAFKAASTVDYKANGVHNVAWFMSPAGTYRLLNCYDVYASATDSQAQCAPDVPYASAGTWTFAGATTANLGEPTPGEVSVVWFLEPSLKQLVACRSAVLTKPVCTASPLPLPTPDNGPGVKPTPWQVLTVGRTENSQALIWLASGNVLMFCRTAGDVTGLVCSKPKPTA